MTTTVTVHVGCAMWTHRGWGSDVPRRRGESALAAYARQFTAVEGNTTFYALPEATTVATWAAALPPTFRLAPKLPRTITHDRRLRDCASHVARVVERLEPLGVNLGPLCIQLPGSFGPDDLGVLDGFLRARPAGYRWAVEVRHPSFAAGATGATALHRILERHDVDRVLLDSTVLFDGPAVDLAVVEARGVKPRLPVEEAALGPHPVLRLIGALDTAACLHGWGRWISTVRGWLAEGREPLVFAHTADNAGAPGLARRLHAAIIDGIPDAAPLPDPADDEPPTLF